MSFTDIMAELEQCGTAQNVKIYRRHGAGDPMFGVSFANLKKIKKKIKVDHALALELWTSGNMDARTLALMIMDPAQITSEQMDTWVKEKQTYYMLVDMLADNIIETDLAKTKMTRWMRSKKEFVRRAGYALLSRFARRQDSFTDAAFLKYLKKIETEIHDSPSRARQMMNITVLNIGLRNDKLHAAALETAKTIGPVHVDHGDTSCKTYDVVNMLSDETYMARAGKSLKWRS